MALRQEKVSERLLELREQNGLSQEQAAQKVGITHRQWQRWEQGESMPYPRNLDLIASRFGLSIAEFFDEEPIVVAADRADQLDRMEDKLDAIMDHLGISLSEDPAAAVERELEAAAAEQRAADRTSQQRSGSSASGEPSRRRAARAR